MAQGAPDKEALEPMYPNLPRASAEEAVALAREQGTSLALRFEDLLGDFWPEDEHPEAFDRALRKWRRDDGALERGAKAALTAEKG